MAKTYDCKYIEVSAAIDHKIDDLLVGILKQIRLLRQRSEKCLKGGSRNRKSDDGRHPPPPPRHMHDGGASKHHVQVLGRLFKGMTKLQSKSCDNLYVLWCHSTQSGPCMDLCSWNRWNHVLVWRWCAPLISRDCFHKIVVWEKKSLLARTFNVSGKYLKRTPLNFSVISLQNRLYQTRF